MDLYAYDAFGYKVSSAQTTANPYHYVGGLGYYTGAVDTGLIHVGARYYAPDIGGFITPDCRRRGLSRACVMEAIRRCGELGATAAYVGTDKPFYLSFGFHKLFTLNCWLKGLA